MQKGVFNYMNFNKQQQKAIAIKDGPVAVIAGAGSGKSTILKERTKYLINTYDIKENNIAILSFSNPAKENMINKLKEVDISNVNVYTFHSLSLHIALNEGYECNRFNDKGADKYNVINKFRKIDKKLTNAKIENIFEFIGYQKRYGLTYTSKFQPHELMVNECDIKKYFKIYEDYKTENQLTDFEDWINIAIKILAKNKINKINKYTYDYLMVDEHQDSNLIQNKLIKLLCPKGNIFCVFDFKQSIFGFTGSNPKYCMNFTNNFKNAKVINLDINYRSNQDIVNNANNFIKKYYGNYKYYSDGVSNNTGKGNIQKITSYSKQEEAERVVNMIKDLIEKGTKEKDIAILYRLNSHSDYIVPELKKNNIDFDIKNDGTFFKRKEVKLIISLLRLIGNTNDDESFELIYSAHTKNLMLSKKDFENIKIHANRYNLNLFQSLTSLQFHPYYKQQFIDKFIKNINSLKLLVDKKIKLAQLVQRIYTLFNIEEYIEDNWKISEQEERKNSISTLKQFAKGTNIDSFIQFANGELSYKKNGLKKKGIQLMTIHSSKGLEFNTVFIVGIEDGKFPHDKSDLMEEARVFYVGITRPKNGLILSQIYDGNRFIEEYFN